MIPKEKNQTEEQMIQNLFKQALKQVKEKPKCAYDFCLLFESLKAHTHALEILEHSHSNQKNDLYKIQLLMNLKKYKESLDLIKSILHSKAYSKEVEFDLMYLRAQALKGMGCDSQAIQIITQIVDYNPQYRAAQFLLTSWKKE